MTFRLTGPARQRIRLAVAALVAAALVVAWLAYHEQPHARAIVWSSLMLASFVGWGSVVDLWIGRGRRADWGLRAGWGMAAFVLLGGFLTVVHVVGPAVLVGQVLLGVGALLGIGALRRGRAPLPVSRRRWIVAIGRSEALALAALTYGLAALTALAVLGDHWFSKSDDYPLYLSMAEKLAQTGSLYEPFAARRAVTFGGHVYLEAAFLAVSSPYYAWIVDDGLGVMVTVALLVGHVRRVGLRAWHWLPLGLTLLLFFSLERCRANTASLFTAVASMVTLFRTVRTPLGGGADRDPWPIDTRRLVALGALTCVPILLRTSNAAGALPFVTLVLASDYLLATKRPWSRPALLSLVRAVGVLTGAFVLALAPWSVMLAQSCGTLFYPFGHSHITPGWLFLRQAVGIGPVAKAVVEDLTFGKPLASLLPFFVAGMAPLRGRARNDLVALTIASAIGILIVARQMSAFGADDTVRYYYADVVAMALLTTASVGGKGPRAALIAACLGMHVAASRDSYHATLRWDVETARKARSEDRDWLAFDALTDPYRDVQSHIPPGATMATAVNENDCFDFARNRIFTLDQLGGMGPPPGWPTHQSPAILAQYLESQGVRYVVWVDFDHGVDLYNRGVWREHSHGDRWKESYLSGEAGFELDAGETIEKLPTIRHLVYHSHDMNVVDLTAPP